MSVNRRDHDESPREKKPAPSDASRFRPIGIPAVKAAARQMQHASHEDAKREAERKRETPAILRDHED